MKKTIMDGAAKSRSEARIAHEIMERNSDESDKLCIVGIRRRGVYIAADIADNIKKFYGVDVPVGELDITLYRDDLSSDFAQPVVSDTKIDFPVKDKVIVLVDDVIYTGRTARAAMEAILALGRPAKIQLAVLIDRGHRELPIRGDYVGKNVPTSKKERIRVCVPSLDGGDEVLIVCEE